MYICFKRNARLKSTLLSTSTGIDTKDKDKGFSLVDIAKGEGGDGDKAVTDFSDALDKLDDAIDNITDRKSIIGAAQNRLSSALETLTIQQENLSSAKSIIKV